MKTKLRRLAKQITDFGADVEDEEQARQSEKTQQSASKIGSEMETIDTAVETILKFEMIAYENALLHGMVFADFAHCWQE